MNKWAQGQVGSNIKTHPGKFSDLQSSQKVINFLMDSGERKKNPAYPQSK